MTLPIRFQRNDPWPGAPQGIKQSVSDPGVSWWALGRREPPSRGTLADSPATQPQAAVRPSARHWGKRTGAPGPLGGSRSRRAHSAGARPQPAAMPAPLRPRGPLSSDITLSVHPSSGASVHLWVPRPLWGLTPRPQSAPSPPPSEPWAPQCQVTASPALGPWRQVRPPPRSQSPLPRSSRGDRPGGPPGLRAHICARVFLCFLRRLQGAASWFTVRAWST